MTTRWQRYLLGNEKQAASSRILFLILALSLGCVSVFAQVTASSAISGTVTDKNGAVVKGATITATNKDTGLQLTAVSDDTGNYTVTNVLPGSYDVKVSLAGFKEFLKTDVPVTTANISRVDATLQGGQLAETVTVAS